MIKIRDIQRFEYLIELWVEADDPNQSYFMAFNYKQDKCLCSREGTSAEDNEKIMRHLIGYIERNEPLPKSATIS